MTTLAIDVGSTNAKVGIVHDGTVVAHASTPVDTSTSGPDGAMEQDADQWWSAVSAAIRALPADDRSSIDAVAVTGQMQDLLCIGADGRPVRSVVLYSDTRAAAEADELGTEVDGWADEVGRPPDATSVGAKWRWLQRHEPQTVAATDVVVFGGAAEIVRRLTGVARCDHTVASTTGLYHATDRRWWDPIISTLQLPASPLDDGRPHAVNGAVADTLGLPTTARVVLAPGDAVATTLGIVGTSPDRPYAYLGTSGWVAASTTTMPTSNAFALPGLRQDHWVAAAPMIAAGATVDWARAVLLGDIDHDELDRLTSGVCAAASGVLALPHLDGQRLPEADATARVALVGMGRSTTRATIGAAVLEGVAHALRQLTTLVAPGDGTDGELLVCGGGSRSDSWCQAIADVTGRTVIRTDDEHASLIGAALAADGATAPSVGSDNSFIPDAARHGCHQTVAPAFDDLGPALAPITALLQAAAAQRR
ncbi:MAG: FGGY family carbohydrate kinase [Actinomycetota bacterium]